MDKQLVVIFALTFLIHLIATLAYSVRIAGARTGRIAVSLSLFNILVLISRTSNSFQEPLLTKRVEHDLVHGLTAGAASDFRWLLLAATLATLVGGILIPTFQRVFGRAVIAFATSRSLPRLLQQAISRPGLAFLQRSARLPALTNLTQLPTAQRISGRVIALNIVATAVATVGVFASLYAGYLKPELRATAASLSVIINGVATIFLFVFIDPYLSILTDDVTQGTVSESYFRRSVVWLVCSRFAGTVLAQILLIPAATCIALVAERL